MKILVTGAAGFIGSNFVRYLLTQYSDTEVCVLDKLTYAGNLENLADFDGSAEFHDRYRFVRGDIAEVGRVTSLWRESFDAIINFASETHVDRSIESAEPFLHTNILGAHALLEACRRFRVRRYLQISTDEVYGSTPDGVCFAEDAPLRPSNPYAASKAAADLLVLSYVHTHRLPGIILRCSNNYGPYQFPEKLIPLVIANALQEIPLPVYGNGLQVRDWIYVEDHCRAIYRVLLNGQLGEIYNVGGVAQVTNLEVIQRILRLLGKSESLITFVEDRPGHDRRYALDSTKLRSELGWSPLCNFDQGLEKTVLWYRSNEEWLASCRGGSYRDYYQRHYPGLTESFSRLEVRA